MDFSRKAAFFDISDDFQKTHGYIDPAVGPPDAGPAPRHAPIPSRRRRRTTGPSHPTRARSGTSRAGSPPPAPLCPGSHDADEQNERARVLDSVHRFASVTHSGGRCDANDLAAAAAPRHRYPVGCMLRGRGGASRRRATSARIDSQPSRLCALGRGGEGNIFWDSMRWKGLRWVAGLAPGGLG